MNYKHNKIINGKKKCHTCKIVKPITDFYFCKSHNHYYYQCKKCSSKYNHELYYKNWEKRREVNKKYEEQNNKTERRKKQLIEITNRMRIKYPEKWDARLKVRNAVRIGKLTKIPCQVCNSKKSEAHHEDYSKQLEVIWLCKKHHTIADRKNKYEK